MITAMPLPGWMDAAAALCGRLPDADRLADAWRRNGDEAALWFSRGAWALAAIVSWYADKTDGERPRLWLPDYFCNHSTAAARNAGARLTFYPVGPDLRPDWPACRMLVGESPPDLFVLVHYFGCAADAQAARDFCDHVNAVLIEDAAHVLAPGPGIGEAGDFVFYSPAKLLAVPDGGLLMVRDRRVAGDIEAAAGIPGDESRATRRWLIKRMTQRTLGPAGVGRPRRQRGFGEDPPTTRLPGTARASGMALRLLARAARQLEDTAARRRDNARRLAAALAGRNDCVPFVEPDAARAPYRLVLRCNDAATLYETFWQKGWPVESWPDLAPEVFAEGARHTAALDLRRSLLLLPVHQGLPIDRLLARLA